MKGCAGGRVEREMDGQRGRCGPYATQYVQHSLTGTVQSSTRGLSSLVRRFPFLPPSPRATALFTPAALLVLWPSIIIDILYRGLYFIHVSHRGMRLFGILCVPSLLFLSHPLFFPSLFFFFLSLIIWSARDRFFSFLTQCIFLDLIMMPKILKIITRGQIRWSAYELTRLFLTVFVKNALILRSIRFNLLL